MYLQKCLAIHRKTADSLTYNFIFKGKNRIIAVSDNPLLIESYSKQSSELDH